MLYIVVAFAFSLQLLGDILIFLDLLNSKTWRGWEGGQNLGGGRREIKTLAKERGGSKPLRKKGEYFLAFSSASLLHHLQDYSNIIMEIFTFIGNLKLFY